MTSADRSRDLRVGTVVPVWILTLIGAVVIGVVNIGDSYLIWLPIALAAAVLLTFIIQLSTLTREGFVDRIMASVGGAVLILAVATGVLALLQLVNG
ncbi:hypothetical protein BKA04_001010 [Cryobacterium mesophilum]|uniref:hypothetical protein n=1 Tax=Terrimesophilobacter mesophilus TaxID=433647 RepID=UPI0017FF0CDD|nr:hypothetical protein [Terrimesophilobacter mesophilus]MBB5632787.1 hypothetical protein [Terrimesophilobacter mesophilus]